MAYNRKGVDSSEDSYNVNRIDNDDFESNTVFVPIDSNFVISFDEPIDPATVSVYTTNTDVETSKKNKRGSIQMSSVGDSTLGTSSESLNMRTLKQDSKPSFVNDSSSGVLAKDQTATIEVEMLGEPVESNNQSTYTITPKSNLASNTTYFFNFTPDIIDVSGGPVSFGVGTGFVTDNTRSVILSSAPFEGRQIVLDPTNTLVFEEGEKVKKMGRNRPTATILKQENPAIVTYELDNYYVNASFTAANPCVITTSSDHGLFSDNKITVYDLVSGVGLEKRVYNISSVTTDTITLEGTNTSEGTAGYISFYVDFHAEDEIVSLRDSDNIQIKVSSDSNPVRTDVKLNAEFYQRFPHTTSTYYGRTISYDEETYTLSYVPITGAESDIISSADNFANNIILQQGNVTMFVSANTNPSHNVHPFNTSAPRVVSFTPDEDDAVTRNLEILDITRSGTTVTVLTNSVHDLDIGDSVKIEGAHQVAYNKTTTVQTVPSPFEFTYEVVVSGNTPRSPATGDIILKTGSTPATQATAFQVQFSQSMNTSTISVANASHTIFADGTITAETNKALASIQLSYDNFGSADTLVNCKSISANTGNTLFTIIPETLLRGKAYNIKVTTDARDLGDTNTEYNHTTTNSFATGTKSLNPLTGKEIIFVDNTPPKIRKITLGSLVIESSNSEELSSPEDLDNIAVDSSTHGNFVVQFNESMNIATVNVNSTDTTPAGTIQVSADDFATVVQMSAQPTVSTTNEKNDTFTFSIANDLSAESNYIIKVTKGVSDDSVNRNFLVNDNVSSVKMMTVSDANGTFTVGESIKGTRTMTVTANTKAVTEGITAGELILGTTSLAKGRIYDVTTGGGKIVTLRYTELESDDGNVREFLPGETVEAQSTTSVVTLSNTTITVAPEGEVVSHDFDNNKLIYKEANSSYPFTAGSTLANDRVTGASSNVVAKSSVTTAITNSGITTAVTALTVTALMRRTNDAVVDVGAGAVTDIDVDSNVIIKFSQTMNADTIVVNSTDTRVNSTDTVIFSADSNFGNCTPLLPNPTITENGSRFEFKPVILANTSLNLTQGERFDVKITRGAKTKGGSNTASDVTESYAVINSSTYSVVNASVFDNNGDEVILGAYADTTVISANVSKSTPIIIHFSEAIDASTFASGAGNEVQLATASNFGSGQIACTISRSGRFGTQLTVIPNATLTAAPHYLRIIAGGTNTGGQALSATWQAGYFTTA